jgi:hypothetical protein
LGFKYLGIRKYISLVLFVLGSIVCNAQLEPFHQLVSTSGAIYNGPVLSNGIDNVSWTVGEVIVFNEETHQGNFSIAQSMQSYPPFVPIKNCPTITVTGQAVTLCESASSISTVLSYNSVFSDLQAARPELQSVQWYFSDDDKTFSKIVGAISTSSNTYQPYFPGYYKVVVKYVGVTSCDTFSTSVLVKTLPNSITPPLIFPSGSPTSLLTATASKGVNNSDAISLQWYVRVPSLDKYLMIAGGNKPSQKVRYNGDYMVIATYAGGCRLSSTFGVTGHGQDMQRTTDFRIEGNTIYIPDEEAPEHSALSVYPNPTLGDFVVRFQSTDEITANAHLYTNTGVFVKEIVFTEGSAWSKQAKVETDDLSAGVYFLKVNQGNKNLVQKVVIYK